MFQFNFFVWCYKESFSKNQFQKSCLNDSNTHTTCSSLRCLWLVGLQLVVLAALAGRLVEPCLYGAKAVAEHRRIATGARLQISLPSRHRLGRAQIRLSRRPWLAGCIPRVPCRTLPSGQEGVRQGRNFSRTASRGSASQGDGTANSVEGRKPAKWRPADLNSETRDYGYGGSSRRQRISSMTRRARLWRSMEEGAAGRLGKIGGGGGVGEGRGYMSPNLARVRLYECTPVICCLHIPFFTP